jgi:putative salt-induced outer membrane protein YdiY
MAKKFSQLDEAAELTGEEFVPIAHAGKNYKVKLKNIKFVTKADIGLGNVDNTSDLNKPLSNDAIDAFALKANKEHTHEVTDINNLDDHIRTVINETDDVGDIVVTNLEW